MFFFIIIMLHEWNTIKLSDEWNPTHMIVECNRNRFCPQIYFKFKLIDKTKNKKNIINYLRDTSFNVHKKYSIFHVFLLENILDRTNIYEKYYFYRSSKKSIFF